MRQLVVHDVLDKQFKSICGAVAISDSLNLSIHISRRMCVSGVNLNLYSATSSYTFALSWTGINGEYDVYGVEFSLPVCGIWHYYFSLINAKNEQYVGINGTQAGLFYDNVSSWQLSCYEKQFDFPIKCENKIMYHVFVDRFCRVGETPFPDYGVRRNWGEEPFWKPNENGKILNNDFFGGNLQGIISKLDYLKSLNVGLIYISPIFRAYSSHRYDTGDYYAIDRLIGGEDDLLQLVIKAKKLGIGIVLDGVFNHCGSDSFYFNKANTYNSIGAFNDITSPYYDWFIFSKYPQKYLCWWDFETLPTFNHYSDSLQEFFTGKNGVIAKWTSFGISGWRLDVVDELCDDFLDKIVYRIKNVNPKALVIGEVWEDASNKVSYGNKRRYFEGKQLDSVMNYPLRSAIAEFLRNGDCGLLTHTCFNLSNNYPQHVLHNLMNILGTHDTERILTFLAGKDLAGCSREVKAITFLSPKQLEKGKKLLRLAATIIYTMCGFPCVYYGDEAGLSGYNDPFNRQCFPWGKEDIQLVKFFAKLGNIRKKANFANSPYTPLVQDKHIFAYARGNIIVAVNAGEESYILNVGVKSKNLLTNKMCEESFLLLPHDCVILAM